jgi:hypothetical protein
MVLRARLENQVKMALKGIKGKEVILANKGLKEKKANKGKRANKE